MSRKDRNEFASHHNRPQLSLETWLRNRRIASLLKDGAAAWVGLAAAKSGKVEVHCITPVNSQRDLCGHVTRKLLTTWRHDNSHNTTHMELNNFHRFYRHAL